MYGRTPFPQRNACVLLVSFQQTTGVRKICQTQPTTMFILYLHTPAHHTISGDIAHMSGSLSMTHLRIRQPYMRERYCDNIVVKLLMEIRSFFFFFSGGQLVRNEMLISYFVNWRINYKHIKRCAGQREFSFAPLCTWLGVD